MSVDGNDERGHKGRSHPGLEGPSDWQALKGLVIWPIVIGVLTGAVLVAGMVVVTLLR